MAEEWTDLVWVCISLIAFAIVLTIAFNFMQLGKGLTNTLYQEHADTERVKEVQTFLPYDNIALSGSEAFAACVKMANNGYPVVVVCSPNKAVFMYDAQVGYTTAARNLGNVANMNELPSFSSWYTAIAKYSHDVFISSNIEYTTPALLEQFDNIAKGVTGVSDKTFSEWTFRSMLLEDVQDRPMGLIIYRTTESGTVVC